MNIDDSTMGMVVGKAILEALDDKARDGLIQKAVADLIAPQKDHRGREGRSRVEEIFTNQVSMLAQKYIREELENNEELKAKILSLSSALVERLLLNEKALDSIASAMSDAVSKVARGYE